MGLYRKVEGDGLDGRYLSVGPPSEGGAIVPEHRVAGGPMLPGIACEMAKNTRRS